MPQSQKPSDEEIEDQIALATGNPSAFAGLSYMQGIEDALLWATGQSDEPPIDPEEL